MSYITYKELINRYPIIGTWNSSESIVTDDLIYYAEKQVESMLAPAFTVPFTAGHPTVKDLCIDMAYFKAMATKDPVKAEPVRKFITARIERIKAGEELFITSSGTITANSAADEIWSTVSGYVPVHSMLGVENIKTGIDPDLINDLEDER